MKKITDQYIKINTTNSPRGTSCDITYEVDPDNQYQVSGYIYVSGDNGITNALRFGEDALFSSGNHNNPEQSTYHIIQYYPSGIPDTYLNLYDSNNLSFPRWHNLETGRVSSTNSLPLKNITALLTNSSNFQDFLNSNTGLMVEPTGGIVRVVYSGAAISDYYISNIIPIEMPMISLEIHKNVETDHFLDYSIDYDIDYSYPSDPGSPTRSFMACRNYITKKDYPTNEGTYGKDYANNAISSEQIISLPTSGLLPNSQGSGIINIDYHLSDTSILGQSQQDMIGGVRRYGQESNQGQTGRLGYHGNSNINTEDSAAYNGNSNVDAVSPIYTAYPDFDIHVDTYINKILRHKEKLNYKGVNLSVTRTTGVYNGYAGYALNNFAMTGMLTLKGGEVRIDDLRNLMSNTNWFGINTSQRPRLRDIWRYAQYSYIGGLQGTTDQRYYINNPHDTNTSGLFIVQCKEAIEIGVVEKRFTNNFLSEDSEWRTRPTTSYTNYQKFVPSRLTWSKVNNDIYNNSDITFQTQLPYRYGESNRSALTDGWENTTISNEQYSKKSFAKKIVGINKSKTKGFFTNTYPYDYGDNIYKQYQNGNLLANQYYRMDGLIEGDVGVDRVHTQSHEAAEQC